MGAQHRLKGERRNTFTYDEQAAKRVVEFLTTRIHFVKGPKYGKPLELLEYQKDFVERLFGEKKPDGLRRYNHAFLWVPRKNSKTTFCSGLGLYMLGADKEWGARVVCVAGTKKQASLLLDDSKHMVKQDKVLSNAYTVRQYDIKHLKSNSMMWAIAYDPDGAQGLDISCGLLDELHVYRNNKMYNAIDSGTIARKAPLVMGISTAGVKNTWAHGFYRTCKDIEDGNIDMPNWLVRTYEAPEPERPFDIDNIAKGNPGWGVTVNADIISELIQDAKNRPEALNEFRRFHRNEWVGAYVNFIPSHYIEQSQVDPIDWEEFKGKKCYIGIDLSSRDDLTAISFLIDNEDGTFYWKCRVFSPLEMILFRTRNPQTPYSIWREKGYILETPGKTLNHVIILEDLLDCSDHFDVQGVGYDNHNATMFVNELEEELSTDYYQISQTIPTLSEPTKTIKEWFLNERIKMDKNDCIVWQGDNIQIAMNANGDIRMHKGESFDKIDAFASLANAVRVWMECTLSTKKPPPGIFIAGKKAEK